MMKEKTIILITFFGVIMILSGIIIYPIGVILITKIPFYNLNLLDCLIFLGGLILLAFGNSLCRINKHPCSMKIMFIEGGFWFLALLNLSVLALLIASSQKAYFFILIATLLTFEAYWRYSKIRIEDRIKNYDLFF